MTSASRPGRWPSLGAGTEAWASIAGMRGTPGSKTRTFRRSFQVRRCACRSHHPWSAAWGRASKWTGRNESEGAWIPVSVPLSVFADSGARARPGRRPDQFQGAGAAGRGFVEAPAAAVGEREPVGRHAGDLQQSLVHERVAAGVEAHEVLGDGAAAVAPPDHVVGHQVLRAGRVPAPVAVACEHRVPERVRGRVVLPVRELELVRQDFAAKWRLDSAGHGHDLGFGEEPGGFLGLDRHRAVVGPDVGAAAFRAVVEDDVEDRELLQQTSVRVRRFTPQDHPGHLGRDGVVLDRLRRRRDHGAPRLFPEFVLGGGQSDAERELHRGEALAVVARRAAFLRGGGEAVEFPARERQRLVEPGRLRRRLGDPAEDAGLRPRQPGFPERGVDAFELAGVATLNESVSSKVNPRP